jgi:hypothetical protein
MTTSNTLITKEDTPPGILAQFQTQVTDVVNGLSKWNIGGTNEFLYNAPVLSFAIDSTNFGGSAPLKAGSTVSTEPTASALSDVKVSAEDAVFGVETVLRNAVVALSNARQHRLRKYYYNAVYTLILHADYGVQMGHLTDTYRIALGSVPTSPAPNVQLNSPVSASTLDAYVTTLDGILTAHRANTVDFNEYWCHSACHSSHSSRNRR